MVQNYFYKEHNTVSALKVFAIWQGKQNRDQISLLYFSQISWLRLNLCFTSCYFNKRFPEINPIYPWVKNLQ